jgi:hypothetical protein
MVGREIKNHRVPSEAKLTPGFLKVLKVLKVLNARNARSSRYPNQRVSFDAARGEIPGFAGLVGAGRSEMVKAMVGLDEHGCAEVTLGDKSLVIRHAKDSIGNGILLVPEDRRGEGLVTAMSVRENTTLPSLGSYSTSGIISKARESVVAKMQMQPFIVTLCGLLLYRGVARFIANDDTKGFGGGEGFEVLRSVASGKLLGIPMPFVLLIIIGTILWVVLHRSVYGRYLLAVGRNEEAARFSGINTRRVITGAYVIAGLLTGVSGIMIAFYTNSVSPSNHANSYELLRALCHRRRRARRLQPARWRGLHRRHHHRHRPAASPPEPRQPARHPQLPQLRRHGRRSPARRDGGPDAPTPRRCEAGGELRESATRIFPQPFRQLRIGRLAVIRPSHEPVAMVRHPLIDRVAQWLRDEPGCHEYPPPAAPTPSRTRNRHHKKAPSPCAELASPPPEKPTRDFESLPTREFSLACSNERPRSAQFAHPRHALRPAATGKTRVAWTCRPG